MSFFYQLKYSLALKYLFNLIIYSKGPKFTSPKSFNLLSAPFITIQVNCQPILKIKNIIVHFNYFTYNAIKCHKNVGEERPRRFASRYISTTIHFPFGGQLYNMLGNMYLISKQIKLVKINNSLCVNCHQKQEMTSKH